MANLFGNKDRRVVPNWRSFGATTELGELSSIRDKFSHNPIQTNIDEYILDWKTNKTLIHAADLISAAISNLDSSDASIVEAANFVIEHSIDATFSQKLLANRILKSNGNTDSFSQKFNDFTLENLTSVFNSNLVWKAIKEKKDQLKIYPRNAILYVELSRYYSILGHESQSLRMMKTALQLAPHNRFVLRCATRLFVHFKKDDNDSLEYIHDILRKNPLTLVDPWLASAEISISTIRNRTSRFIKKGIDLIYSNNISPFNFTELASSIGTIELLNGSIKKSREFFNKSLINPNDNSLAQIEWASTKDSQLSIDQDNFSVKMNFEALALDSCQNKDYENALENTVKWFIDMPFSKRPILFGSNLASTILKDQEKSIALLKAGLISHPNDAQLLNNIAYALALDGRASEAFDQLNKIKQENIQDEETDICIIATRGLSFFRSGFPEVGRKLYLEAIQRANQIKNSELNWIAILNCAREEIFVESEYCESLMDAVSKIPNTSVYPEVDILKNEVTELYDKMKNKPSL